MADVRVAFRHFASSAGPRSAGNMAEKLVGVRGFEPPAPASRGHKGQTITSRYVHSADAVLLAAADAVANRTAELMGEPRGGGEVIELRRQAAG
jgi:hypothetical protein